MAIAAPLDIGFGLRRPSTGSPELGALEGIPAFSGLTPAARSVLASASSIRHLSRRQVVASEGTVPSHVFVVLRGKVRAIRRSESGREVTLETYHPGDFLADALRGPERALTNDWEVAEPCDLLAIGRDALAAQIVATPGLALTMLNQTLDRLDRTKNLASGLALTDVPERVIAAVRNLAASSGKEVPEGVSVHNRPTQQELANSIGACRETVSRVISDLVRKGLVTLRGRSMIVSRKLLA
ncbi:MAG TPA: Crp/Fnr family transcriptional regulator [Polyangia bacterium]|jgi:CRP-like cAMP-binding protein|nr:Crp/Fnr family transcriptional regulator [Polyangia bacterium]